MSSGKTPPEKPTSSLANALGYLGGNRATPSTSSTTNPSAPTLSPVGPSGGSAKIPRLNIKTLDGRTVKIEDARSDWTVKRLKEEFAKWQGPGWDNVALFYTARRLNDNELLSKYNIVPDAVIQANYRSKGGESEGATPA